MLIGTTRSELTTLCPRALSRPPGLQCGMVPSVLGPLREDGGVTRPHDFERRRRIARRMGLVTAVWLIATAISLGTAATTAIGPVVLELSNNHGVHAGDLVGFAGCYLGALALTAKILHNGRS
jgi:hypothetical protein